MKAIMFNTSEDVMEQARSKSLAQQARITGLFYLTVIAGGLFAEGFVRGSLIVPGDAAATVQSIAANESLWRLGLAVHLLYLVAAVMMNVLLYGLFKPVQATLARLALVFSMTGVTVEAVNLLHLYVPLAMIDEGGALAALDEGQRQALAYLAIRLFPTGWGFALLFFAGFCVPTGVLILRSHLMPRVIGALMIVAGVCYLVNSLALILAPALSSVLVPWILLPCLLAELSLALWLAVKGVKMAAMEAHRATHSPPAS
ncbi:MAG TPA: DUF4386 domain-containing protein [Chloroflexota bacterium]|nr:DUF4386 domain-containing protein [Chloroflexota bacterium]